MYNMKAKTVPQGVWFSSVVMTTPLALCTLYVAGAAPLAANAALLDPSAYAYMARTTLRLLSLNMAFIHGIHFGLGSAQFDVLRNEDDKERVKR